MPSFRNVLEALETAWDSSLSGLKSSLATKLDKTNDAVTSFPKAATPVNLTASGQILSGPGQIIGYHINSHTAGATYRISDALTATTPYLGAAVTTVAGNLPGTFMPFPAILATGGYVTIAGTIDITFFVIAE